MGAKFDRLMDQIGDGLFFWVTIAAIFFVAITAAVSVAIVGWSF